MAMTKKERQELRKELAESLDIPEGVLKRMFKRLGRSVADRGALTDLMNDAAERHASKTKATLTV